MREIIELLKIFPIEHELIMGYNECHSLSNSMSQVGMFLFADINHNAYDKIVLSRFMNESPMQESAKALNPPIIFHC